MSSCPVIFSIPSQPTEEQRKSHNLCWKVWKRHGGQYKIKIKWILPYCLDNTSILRLKSYFVGIVHIQCLPFILSCCWSLVLIFIASEDHSRRRWQVGPSQGDLKSAFFLFDYFVLIQRDAKHRTKWALKCEINFWSSNKEEDETV